jgi:hypothetical protein
LDHAIIFAFAEGDGRKKKKKKDRTQWPIACGGLWYVYPR